MSHAPRAFWHHESFARFVHEGLPGLLADRLPITGYRAEPAGEDAVRIRVSVAGDAGAEYGPLPAPDADGVFRIGGREVVVFPVAEHERLDRAEVRCVGEQLLDFVAERLGRAPAEMEFTEDVLRRFLPLDAWVVEFFADPERGRDLEDTNPLARLEHLRRLLVPGRGNAIGPEQLGRVCPVQTPEGPNVGRVLPVARGAAIRDGRVVIEDDSPEAALSYAAASIPFLDLDDPARALMGANMMRQWLPPETVEPATVRTGLEPDVDGFWCGRDLLTAFVSMGGDTFEDGIVVSESAAARLGHPDPLEVGDKLSNRHGGKGVVARILPDAEMPRLEDGTPVELVYDFIGAHARRNQGLLREALLSRIARAEGEPAIAGPFDHPDAADLRARAETGMRSESGTGGKRPTVGWVYWGKTRYVAAAAIRAGTAPGDRGCQLQGDLEFAALRDAGATANVLDLFGARAGESGDGGSPAFARFARSLAAAGIAATIEGERVRLSFAPAPEPALDLAAPVPHPWHPGRTLDRVGEPDDAVREANERLRRVTEGGAPESLVAKTRAALADAVARRLDDLLPADAPGVTDRILFSGRAVAAPGPEFSWDRVGLPDAIARRLFGEDDPDAAMEDAFVLVNRNPSLTPFTIVAFRPVRIPERVVRLPLAACWPLNADFDGDQVAVFRPLGDAARREAGERLTLAGHAERDPELLRHLVTQTAVFGLALRSLDADGRREVEDLAGGPVSAPDGFVTREGIGDALVDLAGREGARAALDAADRLLAAGLAAARASGASISPFADEWLADHRDEPRERLVERIESSRDFDDPLLGPQLLAVLSGARGTPEWLLGLLDRPADWLLAADESRARLVRVVLEFAEKSREAREAGLPRSYGVLARAARSPRPGIVFASAAATGESDPLLDDWTRLFVGQGA